MENHFHFHTIIVTASILTANHSPTHANYNDLAANGSDETASISRIRLEKGNLGPISDGSPYLGAFDEQFITSLPN